MADARGGLADGTESGLVTEEPEAARVRREARQAVADRQHVLSVVSHDLRNPLHTVVMAVEMLRLVETPEARARGLDAIARAAERMNRMIADLLDVNSIEAGRLSLQPAPLDPVVVLDEVQELFGAPAARRGLAFRREIPEGAFRVRADRHRLIQALGNLVSNALKATEEGAITLSLEPRPGEVVFAVADTGPGIPHDARPRIFEPYWRSGQATYKGTGLGLAIVRGIVEGHGGRVWIEDAPGGGACFRFTIPAA